MRASLPAARPRPPVPQPTARPAPSRSAPQLALAGVRQPRMDASQIAAAVQAQFGRAPHIACSDKTEPHSLSSLSLCFEPAPPHNLIDCPAAAATTASTCQQVLQLPPGPDVSAVAGCGGAESRGGGGAACLPAAVHS